ncbi:universal stress protein [Echinicola sp. CAU 1574]|uniref:Universal stress protein n=1 Tax=Echinicola arenosa TaxID=2774144 RepID=A0ABR9AIY4_9BACT|nr:universal stress protein [Echinicola arenosa]MBD8488484.1 universal stress protein [Echinicola arenosa]
MKKIRHIALCLDLTEMDNLLLSYVKRLDDYFEFDSLTLLHLIEIEELPSEINSIVPELGKSIEEVIQNELSEKAETYFGKDNENIRFHIHQGGDVETFASYMDKEDFGLVILGKKSAYLGSGILSGKIVRLINCNTLFVPEITNPNFENVVITLDFSSYSDKVINIGLNLKNIINSSLHPVHVIKSGVQYFPYIKNFNKYAQELENEAKKQYKRFQKKHHLSEEITLLKDSDLHISKLIYNYAVRESANLIIAGNKGKKDEGDLLIGSIAEQLIAHDKNLPVLIVK